MKISLTGAPEYMDRTVGYGEASVHIAESFKTLGVDIAIKDPSALINISFCQPQDYSFNNKYNIGYTPWESTEFYKGWQEKFDKCDEVWATSEWVAEIYRAKLKVPVFVFEHGIEKAWVPKKRKHDAKRPFRFLHIGEPAFRKDAQLVLDAFISLYGDDPNYELVMKCSGMNTTRIFDRYTGNIKSAPDVLYDNVKVITSYLSVEQMNGLYDLCDVFVYPSWGEGFGFNPLQAMGMAMPTICTADWASYKDYITMPVDSKWWPSPWPGTHPGLMLKPNYNQVKEYMKYSAEQYDEVSSIAFKNALKVHNRYDWLEILKPAVERLQKIYNSLI